MQVRKQQAVEGGGEQVSYYVAFLEEAGEEAAVGGGQGFEGEGCAYSPDSAHGDAEEGSAEEEAVEGGRERGGEFEAGEGNDVEHQGGAAADALGHEAEEEGPDWTHNKCPDDRLCHFFNPYMELGCDGGEADGEEEEVEGVEAPAEEEGGEGVSL